MIVPQYNIRLICFHKYQSLLFQFWPFLNLQANIEIVNFFLTTEYSLLVNFFSFYLLLCH